MNAFVESGMTFGPFRDETVFLIEKSKMQRSCTGVKVVEFIWHRKKNVLCFVEAKSSSTINRPGNEKEHETFMNEICSKFTNSVDLFLTGLLERKTGHDEIHTNIKNADYRQIQLKFVLILKGHEREDLLAALRMDLEQRLRSSISIWGCQLLVLNEQLAKEHRFIS